METKICTKCGNEFPRNEDYFFKRKTSKDGFRNQCKICRAKQDKQYYEDNTEKLIEQMKKYQQNNAKQISEKNKQYRQENAEKISEWGKQYYKDNIEKIKQYRNANVEYKKQYYLDNIEKIAERSKRYRQKNVDKIVAYGKKYCNENSEKRRVYSQRRRSKKEQLPSTLTTQQWKQIKQHFNNRCAYCNKELPLVQEHFIPLNNGGEYTVNNIIPSCKSCNSSKGTKDFIKWYRKFRYYSKKREDIILKYLGYNDEGEQQLKII